MKSRSPLRARKSAIALAVAAAFIGCARADTFIQANSQPGDYIGGGVDRRLDPDNGVMIATVSTRGVQVRWVSKANPTSDSWTFNFIPPPGQTPAVGSYPNAGPVDWNKFPAVVIDAQGRHAISHRAERIR